MASNDPVYVVQRLNWVWSDDGDNGADTITLLVRIPGVVRLRSFDNENVEGLEFYEVDEDQLCEAVRELGLEPPEPVKRRFSEERLRPQWYDEIADTLTPAQRDGLFKLFAEITVYKVVEVPLED